MVPTMKDEAGTLFAAELQAYERMKDELLRLCEGKHALFKGSEYIGVFDTPEAAYNTGIERFGNVPFLIKPVCRREPVEWFPALELGVLHACL